ncbi:hypothetical protein EOL96_00860 [Candidatus Saccharibacteria bacterium]|nr:hypothetical protein [Candidatus Saccharibacteria bacterium]
MLLRRTKLLHRHHTGRISAHEHTSYVALASILLVAGIFLMSYTASAWERPGPAAESIGMSGIVPGVPPSEGATINTPTNGQRFSQTPITVAGKCPKDTLVEIFKNDIFAGSAICTNDGTFTLLIDLLVGQNTLIARVFDSLNQQGPASPAVTVYYDALPPQSSAITSLNFGGPQLLINTDAVFRGAFPGKEMSLPIDILGGRAPYAVNVQWGDSTNKVISRPDNTSFRVSHIYQKAGTFQLSIQATDADGRVAFLTVASIVNGQPDPEVVAAVTTKTTSNTLLMLWPLYAATFAAVISFWLGEWREKRMLIKHGLLSPNLTTE